MVPLFYFHVLDDLDAPDGGDALLPDLETVLLRVGGEAGILICELNKSRGGSAPEPDIQDNIVVVNFASGSAQSS